jgi:hypothetical protein
MKGNMHPSEEPRFFPSISWKKLSLTALKSSFWTTPAKSAEARTRAISSEESLTNLTQKAQLYHCFLSPFVIQLFFAEDKKLNGRESAWKMIPQNGSMFPIALPSCACC